MGARESNADRQAVQQSICIKIGVLMTSIPETLQKQLLACRTLPSVPVVVLEVLDLCRDDDASIVQVAKALSRDPALSAKVLKVANSPWYGIHSEVTTLERAVTIMGINATLSLALSFSLVRGLRKEKTSGFDHQAYWKRSVITAAASQEIGRWANASSQDELFLGGLLQDIGILALNEVIPDLYGRLIPAAKADHALLAKLEREELGSDHADVGAWLLQRWNLPFDLQQAAASSHYISDSEIELSDFCRCVVLAGYVADIWTQSDAAGAASLACEKSASLFDMTSDQFQKALDDVAHILPEVTADLDINIGGEEFVERILDRARAALVELSLQAHRTAHEVRLQAQRDELTSLANRSYLNDMLPQQFKTAQELGKPLSVLFLDIDNFKQINDSYGHRVGDKVLMSIAHVLRQCSRGTDIVARYGGDEFLMLLSNTGEKAASEASTRIRDAVLSDAGKIDEDTEIPVTISIGCATLSASSIFSSAENLVKAADQCLYAAKTGGRNRVVTFDQLPDSSPV
jgi:diguanylate cyclase (GGDEF)-like protein